VNRDREPSRPAPFELEAAADQAIAACGRDTREAVKALIVANGFLEAQVEDCEPRFPPATRAAGSSSARPSPELIK
jgi:hypothetical protein